MKRATAWQRLRGISLELGLAALVAVLFADYLASDKLLYGTDSVPGGIFTRQMCVDSVRRFGELPRWDGLILGGLPFIDAQHGDTFFPSSIFHYIMPVYRGMGHKLLFHIFVAGAAMAFYLRTLRISAPGVAFGAFAYMLSPMLVSYLFTGHDGRLYVTSLAPLAMGWLERAMGTGRIRDFLLLGLVLALTILSAQIQMAYHLMWFIAAAFVVRLFAPRDEGRVRAPRALAGFAAAVAVALGASAIQLLPAVSYVKDPAGFSVRSNRTDYEHASSWSLHPEEVASMVVPEFCNAPGGYWGRNPFKYNSDYLGILTLALAAVAIRRRRDATTWMWCGIAAFAVLYSLGPHTPLHRLCYAIVPQVRLFRAPSLLMFGAAFAFAALAARAVDALVAPARAGGTGVRGVATPAEIRAFLLLAGALVLAGLGAEPLTRFWTDLSGVDLDAARRAAQEANLPAFRRGAWLTGAIVAAATALLALHRRRTIAVRWFVAGLVLLAVVDQWRVDRRFKVVMDPETFLRPAGALARLAEESARDEFRVMPVAPGTTGNEIAVFGIASTLGFHDNELSWYREVRTAPEAEGLLAAGGGDYPLLRMLNVRYVLHDREDIPNPFPIPDPCARFRVVGDWDVVGDRTEIVPRLVDPAFDVGTSVLLEEDPGLVRGDGPAGEVVSWAEHGSRIDVVVRVTRDALLVHADNWFPYWQAWEGEIRRPILRANGTIRAVPLGPGEHRLTFRYRSLPFEWGKWITAATWLGVLAVILAARTRRSGPAPADSPAH